MRRVLAAMIAATVAVVANRLIAICNVAYLMFVGVEYFSTFYPYQQVIVDLFCARAR